MILFRNFTNVQSPGSDSQSSKGSFDDACNSSTTIPDLLNSYINNNYEHDCYVADQDAVNSADSADDLNLDDIDEIDTNNMAIYSGAPILKKDRNGSSGGKVFTGPDLQQQMKEEPKDINNSVIFTNTPESKKEKKSTLGGKVFTGTDVPLQKMKTEPKKSKSLLITSQNKASDQAKQNQPRDDLMNLLKQSSNDHMVAGTSGAQTAPVVDPVVGQNIFDENSQVCVHN